LGSHTTSFWPVQARTLRVSPRVRRTAVMKRTRCTLLGLAVVAALVASVAPACAADWPTRTVRIVLTLGAGSGTDLSARLLADRLTGKWGQPIVVENRPGGDGIV